jgi:hypothetical protein
MNFICICEHVFLIFLQCSTCNFYIISRLTSAIVLGSFNDNRTMSYNVTLSCIRATIVAVEKQ